MKVLHSILKCSLTKNDKLIVTNDMFVYFNYSTLIMCILIKKNYVRVKIFYALVTRRQVHLQIYVTCIFYSVNCA